MSGIWRRPLKGWPTIRTSAARLVVRPGHGWPNSATGKKLSHGMSQSTKHAWAENAGREPGHDPPIDFAEPVSGSARGTTLAQVTFLSSVSVLEYSHSG